MPAVSTGPSNVKTVVPDVASLTGIPTGGLRTGDLAYVIGTDEYWRLDTASAAPVGPTVAFADCALAGVYPGRFIFFASGSGGGSSTDRFARRYIVGIGPTYPAPPQASPWRYIQDPGDGTGLQTALAEAAVNPGDIWISPGTIDFNTGPLTGPLTIPANVTVYGAGRDVTTLIGLSAEFADQGVLRLLSGAQVFDLSIQGGSANPSIGAAALVEMADNGSSLCRMNLTAQTSGDGAPVLRGCIQVTAASGGLQRFITLIDIIATLNSPATATGNVAPLLIESSDGGSVTLTDRFGAFGGNYSARIVSGTLIGDKFIAFSPRLAGISGAPGAGAFRCDQAGIFHDAATAGVKWIGVDVPPGGGWILRSFSIQDLGAPTWDWTGINIQDQTGAIDIDGCIIQGAATCIAGPSLPGTGASLVNIRACILSGRNGGVVFRGNNTNACSLEGCAIDMQPDPLGGPSLAVSLEGAYWAVTGNRIRNQSAPGLGQIAQCLAIQGPSASINSNVILGNGILPRVSLAGPSCTFVGNTVESTDPTDNQPAVDITGVGCAVSGNVVLSADPLTSPIQAQASLTAISGNRVRSTPGLAGITLTALCNNSTAVGNVVETGVPGVPVNDLGAGNAVIGNVGT